MPFVILGSKMIDCTHYIDHTQEENTKAKKKIKLRYKGNLLENYLLKLLGNKTIILIF